MGLFNFINYEKEGKGVNKNEPEKKGFFRFFELYFANFWKLISISFVYDLLTIPILTNGLAAVGAANVTRNMTRGCHSFGMSDFFDTVKKNWRQALPVGIINLVLTVLLVYDLWFFRSDESKTGFILMGISLFIAFVFTVMKYYIPLLIITFSLNKRQIYKNSFRFVFLNLPKNLLVFFTLLLLNIGMLAGSYFSITGNFPIGGALITVFFICVYPAFRSFLIQFCIFDAVRKYMIDPYYAEHPDADIEKRLALGLSVPEEYLPKYDDDDVFSDERILPKTDEE